MQNQNIAYEKFNLIEVKSEDGSGEKNYFIEGHISTIDPDSANDIVTEKGQDNLVEELHSKNITMDLDHESFRNDDGTTPDRDLNKIPVAKIVESKRTALGTYVKAMLNKDNPFFKNILASIKNGFLHSFSIAYHVKDAILKTINGEQFRLLNKVELRNVGITGNPVNTNATFSVSLKSHIKKMVETEKKEEYSKLEESIINLKSEFKTELDNSIKTLADELKKSISELKSNDENNDSKDTKKDGENTEEETPEVKSLRDKVMELEKKLKEPVMTGAVDPEVKSNTTEQKIRGFEAYI